MISFSCFFVDGLVVAIVVCYSGQVTLPYIVIGGRKIRSKSATETYRVFVYFRTGFTGWCPSCCVAQDHPNKPRPNDPNAGIPYAVIDGDGLAVRTWVVQVDEAAVIRTTRDVD